MNTHTLAFIAGASRGIGAAVAATLAARGFDLILAARSERVHDTAARLSSVYPVTVTAVRMDATSPESVAAAFAGHSVDVLVNCVGANHRELLVRKGSSGHVLAHDPTTFEQTVRLNVGAAFLCARQAASSMVTRGSSGVIVNILSAVRHGAVGQSAYAASKAAVESLTHTWALELGRQGIRCVGVAPGVVEGEALDAARREDARHDRYMAALASATALNRFAREEEVADTVAFIVGNEYVTGTVIEVHGGGVPQLRHERTV